ncbi:MAG: 50S ribosomal protein L9 [Candidatus Methanoperedens sp.]|jgi:large subunit ribosomal protein L9|nr:50S ribosomal protein L9 [Candidatus Methanoperedens sp.]
MKVILKENVESLGKAGDAVKVADGYARNYLIPKGLAVEASSWSLKSLEHEKNRIMQKIKSEREKAELMVEKLRGVTCTLHRRAGEQDKLFGSVTTKDIENSLIEQGIEIDRRMIVLEEPVRSLGEFPVKIKLQPGVMAEIKIMVVGEA